MIYYLVLSVGFKDYYEFIGVYTNKKQIICDFYELKKYEITEISPGEFIYGNNVHIFELKGDNYVYRNCDPNYGFKVESEFNKVNRIEFQEYQEPETKFYEHVDLGRYGKIFIDQNNVFFPDYTNQKPYPLNFDERIVPVIYISTNEKRFIISSDLEKVKKPGFKIGSFSKPLNDKSGKFSFLDSITYHGYDDKSNLYYFSLNDSVWKIEDGKEYLFPDIYIPGDAQFISELINFFKVNKINAIVAGSAALAGYLNDNSFIPNDIDIWTERGGSAFTTFMIDNDFKLDLCQSDYDGNFIRRKFIRGDLKVEFFFNLLMDPRDYIKKNFDLNIVRNVYYDFYKFVCDDEKILKKKIVVEIKTLTEKKLKRIEKYLQRGFELTIFKN